MDKRIISDMERNNKVCVWCHAIESVIYIICFASEWYMGNCSLAYFITVILLALLPVAGEIFFWCKNHETKMIKHFLAVGFALMYSFVLFTTQNFLMFVFVIPMVLVVSVYNDTKYTLEICIGTTLESFVVVIAGMKTGGFGFRDTASGLIQIVVMVLVGVYSYITAGTLNANNRMKLENIKAAHDETEQLLGSVSETSRQTKEGIDYINEKLGMLDESTKMTQEAMNDVSSGAGETAQAVQMQMLQTNEIHQKVDRVGAASEAIKESMHQTMAVLENGKSDIEMLVGEVNASVEKGADVAGKLEQLDEYIVEMHSIVALIQGITNQTSLLALNASIEAARAGEAGRGFAVVATEISGMATQTKEATLHITELIENVSGAIEKVVIVIREMIDGINGEKTCTENTAESFGRIEDNTHIIRENVEGLAKDVEELEKANQEIAESVQTISAISEEVAAHATETLDAEDANRKHLDAISKKMKELLELTQHA